MSKKVPENTIAYIPAQYIVSDQALLKDLYILSSNAYAGRKTGTPGSKLAQDFIFTALSKHNYITPFKRYLQPFTFRQGWAQASGVNVIGIIKGTANTDKYIVLTAHYDHLGDKTYGYSKAKNNIENLTVYNGADDNASGVVALLHYAYQLSLHPPKHNVILLFTDAEELGLEGAKQFVALNTHLLDKIVLNINLDMIAGDKRTQHLQYLDYGVFQGGSPQIKKAWSAAIKQMPVSIKKGFTARESYAGNSKGYWLYVSDHGAFYANKIPSLYFGVNPHANYHTETDDYDHVNKDFYVKSVKSIYLLFAYLDNIL